MNATASNTAVGDLCFLRIRTSDAKEQARIDALIASIRAYQRREGYELGSSFTPGFMAVLERERQQQTGASA